MTRYYDWHKTFSYQTGTQGEICLVVGAKDIGKTFGLRLQCINDFRKNPSVHFAEICRTAEEMKAISVGYFDRIQDVGYHTDLRFKVEKMVGYAAKPSKKPEWVPVMYFAALTNFQREKKRTYTGIYRYIFDELAIDRKDRYHRYLPNEFLILANLLDSMSRQQPNGNIYRLYGLSNACDLTCPYFRNFGIDSIPDYGYRFYNHKHTLLHYVEPWDAEERQIGTLVGRMLSGNKESEMIYENRFADTSNGQVQAKTSNARYSFALVYDASTFAIWIDYKDGIFYVTDKLPAKSKHVYTLTKADSTLDYQMVKKADAVTKILIQAFYAGGLRYESVSMRERFLSVLGFLGVQ